MTELPTVRTEFIAREPVASAARAWAAGHGGDPAVPKLASTVMLVRGSASGTEVFMQRRVASMAFAPSLWVFPGGGVDPRDASTDIPWAGPSADEWAALMGVSADVASQLVIAAVREVFEECGVLLAGSSADTVVSDVAGPAWEAERAALLSREKSFAQLLQQQELVLRSDLLALHDHWITPEFEPRRYDTWFFAALMPEGQHADDQTTEADKADWVNPRSLLAAYEREEVGMLPPTRLQLTRIAAATSPAAYAQTARPIVPVQPTAIVTDAQVTLHTELPAEPTWSGGIVTARTQVVLCPNPGPMTLDGTNTWLLHDPVTNRVVVVDPGEDVGDHLATVMSRVHALGATVALVLLTHSHHDHVDAVPAFQELTNAPVRGAGHGEPFVEGERIAFGDLTIRVLLTPGHTADSVSFYVEGDNVLLTGDTVLGRGTSVVMHPDGNLRDYLGSLDRMLALATSATAILGPGHGAAAPDAAGVITSYVKHRGKRLEQVRAALTAGDEQADDVARAVVERVYADVPREVWPAAKATVQAQLEYLRGETA